MSAGSLTLWHVGRCWNYLATRTRTARGAALKPEVRLETTQSWQVPLSDAAI